MKYVMCIIVCDGCEKNLYGLVRWEHHMQSSLCRFLGILLLICPKKGTKITEVHLSAFVYRLFHDDFSPLVGL